MDNVSFCQIHLDFHTSPMIEGIGSRFNGEEFAKTLVEAGVESINLFAKCHHGMYYYPTQIGTMHPNLKFDLFGEQMKACNRHGIRTFAYTCVGWNEDWAERHPEWQQISSEGVLGNRPTFSDSYYLWHEICIRNQENRAYIKRELKEIYDRYGDKGLVGFWIDIILSHHCVCKACRASMKSLCLDPRNRHDLTKHDRLNEITFMQEVFSYIQSLNPSLMAYFNGFAYEADLQDDEALSSLNKRKAISFVDIESLPSDAWGYTHFPVNVNYLNKYDQELTMMNGKFHLSWGDFGSLRNVEALEYECFRALSHGTKVCIGDQLHPEGKLESSAYKRLGTILNSVKMKKNWCRNTKKVSDVGVYLTTSAKDPMNAGTGVSGIQEGVYRILTELHVQFDFIGFQDTLDKYQLIIVPDQLHLPDDAVRKLDGFVKAGGKLIVTGKAGLAEGADAFVIDGFCARYVSSADYQPRYIRIEEGFSCDIEPMDYVVYGEGVTVEATDGAKVLAYVVNPYFNRTYDHFSSHRQTPPAKLTNEPAILMNNWSAYVANCIFADYALHGLKLYKLIMKRLLKELYPESLLKVELPSTAELRLRKQERNYVLHILNYVVQRKCRMLDTIEDRWPLDNVLVEVKTDEKPAKVQLVPGMEDLDFSYDAGYTSVVIPKVDGHQMVSILMEEEGVQRLIKTKACVNIKQ